MRFLDLEEHALALLTEQSDAFQAAQQISTLYKKMGLELREDGGMNNPITGFSVGTPARKSTVGKTKPRIPAYPLEFEHENAERWSETLEYNMTYTMTYNMTYTRSLELFGPVFFSYMCMVIFIVFLGCGFYLLAETELLNLSNFSFG